MLVFRRFRVPAVRKATLRSDHLMYTFLLGAMLLGLTATILNSTGATGDYNDREGISIWFRSLFTFQPDYHLMGAAPLAFQAHILFGFTLFALIPYSRLVHMFSAPVQYLFRPYVVYRRRDPKLTADQAARLGAGAMSGRTLVRRPRHAVPERPFIVIWEATRACPLACLHCRAEAQPDRDPGELDGVDARRLMDQIAAFGKPCPLFVITGGDPFQRADLNDLVAYGTSLGLRVAVSPSGTPTPTRANVTAVRDAGAVTLSLSLDGSTAARHDAFRGVEGVFDRTLDGWRTARELGLRAWPACARSRPARPPPSPGTSRSPPIWPNGSAARRWTAWWNRCSAACTRAAPTTCPCVPRCRASQAWPSAASRSWPPCAVAPAPRVPSYAASRAAPVGCRSPSPGHAVRAS
ncbi:respiratory nitrate reductase subunit gamma [Streptomyces violascens]|uniref:respiratory nitrate reductase subunit gamma n=1 Tax=Streptomyces violascens TaxID=67381 RepID=UPI003675FC68